MSKKIERVEGEDEALDLVTDRINGSALTEMSAWFEGKTLTVLFKDSGQLAKFRFAGLRDKPSYADLRGEPS